MTDSNIGVKPASIEEFQQFLEGEQNMSGGQHDLESRGMTSDDPTMRDPRYAQPVEPHQEAQYVQDGQPQGQNWQALYGREANEKGQWRRTAEEALAQLETLKGSFGQSQAPVYGAPQPQNGHYSQVTPAIQSTNQPPIPERFFPDRDLNDAVLVEDVEAMLKNMVAPEIWNLRAQAQQLQQLQLQAIKGSSGIEPGVEAQLVRAHPWLGSMTDPFARISAMRELVAAHGAVSQARTQVQQPVQVQGQQNGGNAAVRRLTMVESMSPRVSDADMDTQSLMRQDMAIAMQKPYGIERTTAMREVFNKYGVYNTNDFGPGVLLR